MIRKENKAGKRLAFSLLELLAVITILGVIAVLVIPRLSGSNNQARQEADRLNKSEINSAVERWYFEKGFWPADNLSDIGTDSAYFPSGVPVRPTDGTPYSLNSTTHRVN